MLTMRPYLPAISEALVDVRLAGCNPPTARIAAMPFAAQGCRATMVG